MLVSVMYTEGEDVVHHVVSHKCELYFINFMRNRSILDIKMYL